MWNTAKESCQIHKSNKSNKIDTHSIHPTGSLLPLMKTDGSQTRGGDAFETEIIWYISDLKWYKILPGMNKKTYKTLKPTGQMLYTNPCKNIKDSNKKLKQVKFGFEIDFWQFPLLTVCLFVSSNSYIDIASFFNHSVSPLVCTCDNSRVTSKMHFWQAFSVWVHSGHMEDERAKEIMLCASCVHIWQENGCVFSCSCCCKASFDKYCCCLKG